MNKKNFYRSSRVTPDKALLLDARVSTNQLSARETSSIGASWPPRDVTVGVLPTYIASDDGLGPRPVHQPPQLDTDHSRHYGELHGSPSRASGPATWPSNGSSAGQRPRVISPRVPTASKPAGIAAGVRDECLRTAPTGNKLMMTACQTSAQSLSTTPLAASDPTAPSSLPY